MAALGWANTLFLVVTHLLVDLTWTMGCRVLLGLSARLSVALVLVWLLAALPVSALLLRPFVG